MNLESGLGFMNYTCIQNDTRFFLSVIYFHFIYLFLFCWFLSTLHFPPHSEPYLTFAISSIWAIIVWIKVHQLCCGCWSSGSTRINDLFFVYNDKLEKLLHKTHLKIFLSVLDRYPKNHSVGKMWSLAQWHHVIRYVWNICQIPFICG